MHKSILSVQFNQRTEVLIDCWLVILTAHMGRSQLKVQRIGEIMGWGKSDYTENDLRQCHFTHHKLQIETSFLQSQQH